MGGGSFKHKYTNLYKLITQLLANFKVFSKGQVHDLTFIKAWEAEVYLLL